MAMDISGPKWEAIMPIFNHYADGSISQKFYDDAKTRLNFHSVETLEAAAKAYTEARPSCPEWWSHFNEFLPKRSFGGRPATGGGRVAGTEQNEAPAWWGNEGEWGGDWSKASGFFMIIPLVTMTRNLNPKATNRYFHERVAAFQELAYERGANEDLVRRALNWLDDPERRGKSLNVSLLVEWTKEL